MPLSSLPAAVSLPPPGALREDQVSSVPIWRNVLDWERPRLHFIGICGKGMGAIADALAHEGWKVTGSDESIYPPMSEYLRASGIEIVMPYNGRNVPEETDLVIVGKRVREDNPELLHALGRGLPLCSFPSFLRERFLHRSRNAVVTGGVGKTTTTAMLSWVLEHGRLEPDYFIGGLARNLPKPARFKGSPVAVLEGDEYASCFDDPLPKFLHYHPEVAIVTNILEDHPDLYDGMDALTEVFARLARRLPGAGCLVLPDDDDAACKLVLHARCETLTAGFSENAICRITEFEQAPGRSVFRFEDVAFSIPLAGAMNVRNAAMAALAARHFGVSLEASAEALSLFEGVMYRQDRCEIGSCTLVRDKATHPFALRHLYQALRQQHPGRRIVSAIQPRATGGKSWVYQRDLPDALTAADEVILLGSYEHDPQSRQSWRGGSFCVDQLVRDLRCRSVPVALIERDEDLETAVRSCVRHGDVVVLTLPEQAETLAANVAGALRALSHPGISPVIHVH